MLEIKKESKDVVIGFNNSGIPLGKRSESDLIDLAILAHQSGDESITNLFEGNLPTLKQLQKQKMALAEEAAKGKEKHDTTSSENNVNGATQQTPGFAEGNSSKETTKP